MIGEAKLTYPNNDIAQLVRKDILDKFGNRELACYNLYLPGVISSKAKLAKAPDYNVQIKSVKEQVAELNLPKKPSIPRSDGSVTRLSSVGGENITFNFDRDNNKVVFGGGAVEFDRPLGTDLPKAHWVGLKVGFPLGWESTEGTILPYSINGKPSFITLTQEILLQGEITLYLDAAMTSNTITFNWSEDYEPEVISVIIDSSLQDSAIRKIPALPTEPLVNVTFNTEDAYTDAYIQVDVDLELGRE